MTVPPTVHASAVLVGRRAVLICGPSGSGKSRLVLDLLQAGAAGALPLVRLVADDRAHLEPAHGRLLVRPAAALAGLLEVRGVGLRRMPYEPVAVVGMVVELGAVAADRLPDPDSLWMTVETVRLPRLGVAAGVPPLALLLSRLDSAFPGSQIDP
jgi:HPr kinase/phosphorylase